MANPITEEPQDERIEGQIDDGGSLNLNISDDDLNLLLNKKISDSEKFWNNNKGLDLDSSRKKSERFWLGKHYDKEAGEELHEWQIPYTDNRIFTSIETIIPVALSRPAQPIVIPANDTKASREFADKFGDILLAQYENLDIRSKQRMSLRHLLLYNIGILKYRWDNTIGENGDIAVNWVRPHKIVIDKDALPNRNPSFIAEYMRDTIENIIYRFPEAKTKLFKRMGIGSEKEYDKLGKTIGYLEVWFSYYEGGVKKEGLCWKYGDIILDKMKNPNFNYEDPEKNIFPNPRKPYAFASYLNLGKHFIDDISLVANAIPLQEVLNKRGRQIVENADQANTGWVISDDFMSKEDAAKLTGANDEKMVGRGDVRSGVARHTAPQLPPYVIEDKYDARNEIDNIMGTHQPSRGEPSDQPTLGQDILARQGDFGRIDDLVRTAVEPQAQELYNGIAQLMKVFYDKEHIIKHIGKDGNITFLKIKNESIEDNIAVRVKSGTTLPVDKVSMRNEAIEEAKAGQTDPLSLFEDLDKPNPQERAKRLVYYQTDPIQYLNEFLEDEEDEDVDKNAKKTIDQMVNGSYVEPPSRPTMKYLKTMNSFMRNPDFKNLDPEVQGLFVNHMRGSAENAKAGLAKKEGEV